MKNGIMGNIKQYKIKGAMKNEMVMICHHPL